MVAAEWQAERLAVTSLGPLFRHLGVMNSIAPGWISNNAGR